MKINQTQSYGMKIATKSQDNCHGHCVQKAIKKLKPFLQCTGLNDTQYYHDEIINKECCRVCKQGLVNGCLLITLEI